MPKNYIRFKAVVIALLAICLSLILIWFGYSSVKKTVHVDNLWQEYNQEAVSTSYALSRINASFGYGGFIHNFKNFVLRHDKTRIPLIEENLTATYAAIEEYRSLEISEQEIQALGALKNTVDEYAAKFHLAKQLIETELSSSEIDQRVYVDDKPALRAIDYLAGFAIQRSKNQEINTESALDENIRFLSWAWLLIPLIVLTASTIIIFIKRITDFTVISVPACSDNIQTFFYLPG